MKKILLPILIFGMFATSTLSYASVVSYEEIVANSGLDVNTCFNQTNFEIDFSKVPLEVSKIAQKETSLGIKEINIRLEDFPDIRPIRKEYMETLNKLGIKLKSTKIITNQDYFDEIAKLPMSDLRIRNARRFHPELEKENLELWTNGQYDEFLKANRVNSFSETEVSQLRKANITIDDAICLLKEYENVKAIIDEKDEVITEILKKEYQYKIDRAKSYIAKNQLMLQKGINYDDERKELLANGFYTTKAYEYGDDRVNDYEPVLIDGYNSGVADDFLISSRTHIFGNADIAASATQNLWEQVMGLSGNYSSQSLWACWSGSMSQAHEAIDLGGGGVDLKAVYRTSYFGAYAFDAGCDSYGVAGMYVSYNSNPYFSENYTVFYMHCTPGSYPKTGYVANGSIFGEEDDTGLPNNGKHLHFSVNRGTKDTHFGTYRGDNYANRQYSDNPYMYIKYHLSGYVPQWQ